MSIQDRSASDRVTGHLATGILADADVVLVPNPPELVLDLDRELEVLIFPVHLDEHSAIDVLEGWKWSRFALREQAHRPTAATVKLGHHSRYAAQIGPVDSAELASTLDDLGGDLWAALARLGSIPPDAGAIDPSWLAAVTEIERAQRHPKRAEHEFESYEQMVPGWCLFFCFCHPHRHK